MATRLFICTRNVIDEASLSLSAGSVVSTLPITNLQLPARGRIARFNPIATSPVIRWTWGGDGRYANVVMLNRHNLESAATWRVELFNTVDWTGSAVYDSGTVAAVDSVTLGDLDWGVAPLGSGIFDSFLGQKFSIVFPSRVLHLSGRVTINDSGNSSGNIDASRLYVGDATEFTYNFDRIDMGWEEDSRLTRSDGGSARADGQIAYRVMDLNLEWLTEADRAKLLDMARFAGRRKDVLVSAFPGETGELLRDSTMIGRFAELPRAGSTKMMSIWQSRMKITEV